MVERVRNVIALEDPPLDSVKVLVDKVHDGDGFLGKVRAGDLNDDLFESSVSSVQMRLGFIDAPEKGQPGFEEAKEFLSSLILGEQIWIIVLTKRNTQSSYDTYGRLVCVPFIKHTYSECVFLSDTNEDFAYPFATLAPVMRNVELEMVLNGWAWVIEKYGPDDRYFEALEFAQRNQLGIWKNDENVPPWEFKATSRGMSFPNPPPKKDQNSQRCPMDGCGGDLTLKSGRFGPFYGCSNFPACKFSKSAES